MNSQEANVYLRSFINYELVGADSFPREHKLDRVRALLALLGNPQDQLKIVHVAGSKGKGSTCAITASILKSAGFKVGLYTSPHIVHYRERIRVLDKSQQSDDAQSIFSDTISDQELADVLGEIKPKISEICRWEKELGRLSFFEIFTVIALYYFYQKKCDVVVLETGLGGRLDATNVVSSLISVITPISLEHAHILGPTIKNIAGEKAAIIKDKQSKVVLAPQEDSARRVFQKQCKKVGVIPRWVGVDIEGYLLTQNMEFQMFDVKTRHNTYRFLKLPLLGKHQVINACVSIGVIEALREEGFIILDEAIALGCETVYWPGRFEVLKKSPLTILDSAHNEASARAMVNTLLEVLPDKRVSLILGMSQDKQQKDICTELNFIVDKVIFTKANHPRASDLTIKDFEGYFPGKTCFQTSSVQEALDVAQKQTKEDDIVLVTGSIFVASEARKLLCTN